MEKYLSLLYVTEKMMKNYYIDLKVWGYQAI